MVAGERHALLGENAQKIPKLIAALQNNYQIFF